jgi:P4 family phage/plasmid primase-like protien
LTTTGEYAGPKKLHLVQTPEEAAAERDDASEINGTGPPSNYRILVRNDHSTIALELERDLAGSIYADERFYRYDSSRGIWREVGEREIARILQSYSGRIYLDGAGKEKELKIDGHDLRGVLDCARARLDKPGFFEGARPGLAFSNGVVVLTPDGPKLEACSADHRIRYAHPFPYIPNAPRHELDEFFDQLLSNESEDERTARIMLLQEFAGACAFGLAPAYERCLILFGKGGQGKSQILEIFRSVLPSPLSISCVPPHRWGEKFAVEQLAGRLANIVDEIPEAEIVAGATFKAVITGEPLDAERKYQPKFNFRSVAGHLFSCNQLPTTADLSEAFFDRVLLLPLSKKMRGAPGSRPKAAQYVIASCPAGIASWAVDGAARLVRQGTYTIPTGSTHLMSVWRRDCDNVAIFAAERCRPASPSLAISQGNGTRSSVLYQTYRTWAGESGFRPVSVKTFSSRLEAIGLEKSHMADADYWPLLTGSTEPEQ